MGVEFDFGELNILTANLESASQSVGPFVRRAVQVSAHKVRDSARERVKDRKHFQQAAFAIDYELKGLQAFGSTVLDAEIGYNKSHEVAALGNLIEFGAPNAGNQLSPGGELQSALHENEDDFEHGIQRAVADALEAVGL